MGFQITKATMCTWAFSEAEGKLVSTCGTIQAGSSFALVDPPTYIASMVTLALGVANRKMVRCLWRLARA